MRSDGLLMSGIRVLGLVPARFCLQLVLDADVLPKMPAAPRCIAPPPPLPPPPVNSVSVFIHLWSERLEVVQL